MSQPVLVWCEIPVSNIEKACDFYSKTYGYDMRVTREDGHASAVLNGEMEHPAGNLFEAPADKIGTGSMVAHLQLAAGDTVEAAAARAEAAGGTVTGPLREMPFGRFTYATDPDGNAIGLFEARA